MGSYINVIAIKDKADEINRLWQLAGFKGWLIYTRQIIEGEIVFIASDPAQKHLRWIDSVEKWNQAVSIHAEYHGQIFISSSGTNDESSVESKQERQTIKAQINWIVRNRCLFESISNLDDALHTLGLNFECDGYHRAIPYRRHTPSFTDLPINRECRVFKACIETNNPGLWKAYVEWRRHPTWENWKALRSYTPPYKGRLLETIWERVENMAIARDGKHYGFT